MGDALVGATNAAEKAGHLMHNNIMGGAGAYLSSLKRIGWNANGISEIVDEKGNGLILGKDCDPKMLIRLAGRASERR